jgi:hypothetical protein
MAVNTAFIRVEVYALASFFVKLAEYFSFAVFHGTDLGGVQEFPWLLKMSVPVGGATLGM